jgi:hypothetical protein
MSCINQQEAIDVFSLKAKTAKNPTGVVEVSESEYNTLTLLVHRAKHKLSPAQIELCKKMGLINDGQLS